MLYLNDVWKIISSSYGMFAVSIGNILVLFCFLQSRFKWWFFPSLVALYYLSLPFIYKLDFILFGTQTTSNILLAFLGYFADILILICFKEHFWKKITLIFTLHILNRLFTFWGYILHVPLNALFNEKWEVQASVTLVIVIMYALISVVCGLSLKDKCRKLFQIELRRHNWVVLGSIAVSAKLIIDFCSDYAFSLNPYSERKIIWAMISLSTFVLGVLVLYLYNILTIMKHLELKASTDRLVFEKQAQQRYYETQLHNQEELRRMKHDMNGHLNTISRLLSEDKKDNALRYLAELNDYAQSNQKSLYCEDPYLNAVVTNYVEMFGRNETQFEQEIQIGKLELYHVELCCKTRSKLR